MKQTTSRILLILFIFLAGLGLDAKVTISKIEYFPGEDFVQLHMQTDKILPIPDIFYPEKDDLSRLVMRIKDVDFQVGSDALTFDSPVIQGLKISRAAEYSDVEIRLKNEANYRVFTNQTGLYIEFPARSAPVAASAPLVASSESEPVGSGIGRGGAEQGRGLSLDVQIDSRGGKPFVHRLFHGLDQDGLVAQPLPHHRYRRLARPETCDAHLAGELLELAVEGLLEFLSGDFHRHLDRVPIALGEGGLHIDPFFWSDARFRSNAGERIRTSTSKTHDPKSCASAIPPHPHPSGVNDGT